MGDKDVITIIALMLGILSAGAAQFFSLAAFRVSVVCLRRG
jgi:hypothetical protein